MKKNRKAFFRFSLAGLIAMIISFVILFGSCGPTKIIRNTKTVDRLDADDEDLKYLKVHIRNGDLYLLKQWYAYDDDSLLSGYGKLYNPKRQVVSLNIDHEEKPIIGLPQFQIPYNSIALVETNSIENKPGNLAGIAIPGTIGAIISIYCLSNPKACFGSCPTFYAYDGEEDMLMAEGFSSSILPSFEKRDVDMLYWAEPPDSVVKIKLTNEALETHIIRYVNLLAVPCEDNCRVFSTKNGEFYSVNNLNGPLSCVGPEGDCLAKVLEMDRQERYSKADSNNLIAREYVELEFEVNPAENYGLVIGSRQSLLTTYLFYQGLAFTGSEAGAFAARVESGDKTTTKRVLRIWELLGGIEIYFQNKIGVWKKHSTIEEMGPIASDVHLVKLPPIEKKKQKIRLKMTKGLWRIDYVTLASLGQKVKPIQIKPSIVKYGVVLDEKTMEILHDSSVALLTYPGDEYNLFYRLPEDVVDYELFLESKGYYLEWMREEWLAEENLKKARLMFGFPRIFMRRAAPNFKILEPQMEEAFWNSRYVKN